MKTTKIIRYSISGFKPQLQTVHMENVNYHLYNFDINGYPEHLKYQIQINHEKCVNFYKKHLEDFKEGIWFFIDGHKNNQSLNHLKRRVPCWEADVENDVLLYDVNWEKIVSITDPFVECAGCYCPKSQIYKIHNIHKR